MYGSIAFLQPGYSYERDKARNVPQRRSCLVGGDGDDGTAGSCGVNPGFESSKLGMGALHSRLLSLF